MTTTNLADLEELVSSAERFVMIAVPTPSQFEDSTHRFNLEWAAIRRQLGDEWNRDEIDDLERTVTDLGHEDGAALLLAHARGGRTIAEFIDEPVAASFVAEGPLPRLAPFIESRQRAIAHVVVVTDRAGADIIAFDGGTAVADETVQGDTLHIHRSHPGGWSQRRFQQRAENTWERNAKDVADAVTALARQVGARLIAVAGDVRAQTFMLEALPTDLADCTIKVNAGSPDGIADEVVRLVSDIVASDIVALTDRLRTGLAGGTATNGSDETLRALRDGRVETLLVHDDGSPEPIVDSDSDFPEAARVVDAAIAAALRTGARVVVVPRLAVLDGPIAALLRW